MRKRHPEYVVSEEDQQEYEREFAKASAGNEEDSAPKPQVNGVDVIWAPLPGSQEMFLSCPLFEVLFHGTRGPGKTDALLMAFAQHVGKGHGKAWRGIIFRQTYPQLADVQA